VAAETRNRRTRRCHRDERARYRLRSARRTNDRAPFGQRLCAQRLANGQHANLIIVIAKTDPKYGAKGVSLMVVEIGTIVDRCLQLFGGYGYMDEYPISHMYRDARVMRIYAGTNEIMKLLIARSL
jgi:hypothetical protein